MASSLSDSLQDGRKNNFDLLRLLFAVWVLYSHCFVIAWQRDGYVDFTDFTRGQTYLGEIAVNGFFAISGFLITMSWFRSEGVWSFLKKRILRIYPGFIAAALLCALVVAPIGAASVSAYFAQLRPVQLGLWLLTLRKLTDLPPVFLMNPQHDVDGSLWTIRVEFECYLLLPLFALLGFLNRRRIVLVITGLVVLLNAAIVLGLPSLLLHHDVAESVVSHTRLLSYFLSGTTCYLYRDRITPSWLLVVAAVTVLAITAVIGGFNAAMPLAGVYLLLLIAFHPRLTFLNVARKADLSYGIYLYAWPIKQLLVRFFGASLNPYTLFLVALPLTCLAAMLSWFLVEKPFLRLKQKRSPATAPAANG